MPELSFEEEVEQVIEEYRAPDSITNEIREFLLYSGNMYTIIELAKEHDL